MRKTAPGELYRDCAGDRLDLEEAFGLFLHLLPVRGFGEGEVLSVWRSHAERLRRDPRGARLNVYLHLPFCRSLCRYCDIQRERMRSAAQVDAYLVGLTARLRRAGDALRGLEVHSMALGGGTPTLLSERQLARLMEAFHSSFRLSRDAVATFELNPRGASARKLRLARELGFTRASMGVQTFDPSLLRSVDRGYQDRALVARAVAAVRAAGFPDGFNIDLLAGLAGQGPRDLCDSFAAAARFAPAQIQVNLFRPTAPYLEGLPPGGAARLERRLLGLFEGLARRLPPFAAARGYRFRPLLGVARPMATDSDWCFSVESPGARPTAHYYGREDEDDPRLPLSPHSVLALGPAARSRIAGRLFYWEEGPAGYRGHEMGADCLAFWERALRARNGTRAAPFSEGVCLCQSGAGVPRPAGLDFSHTCEFEVPVSIDGERRILRLERVRPGQRYLRESGRVGLQLVSEAGAPEPGSAALLRLVGGVFGGVGRRAEDRCMASFTALFARTLRLWAERGDRKLQVGGASVRSRIPARNWKYSL
ncbi:MAG: hypothetical protein A2X36_16790 [Elusimicrobia bacterium GWA2_69_24]|nr:MAG: hypothetical protein A2X36_16790 [Elusimicrobia bacterium GWA2_69_24]HBL16628.1 hypothetical protein [Elusimicrobiota bacterium]